MTPVLKRSITALFAATLLVGSTPAPAHAAGPNGGATRLVDGHAVEFVASERTLTFYLCDHDGTLLATGGVSARAFVSLGTQTQTITLAPASPNRLVGTLAAPLPPGARVVLAAKVPGHRILARFEN